ncbi:hypothetical protein BJ742DRAFT_801232 [Cladochytrium replicatum]|nr:hypothetical protein BJ742DRAFT_801232 [Cladochytrium replicatum]
MSNAPKDLHNYSSISFDGSPSFSSDESSFVHTPTHNQSLKHLARFLDDKSAHAAAASNAAFQIQRLERALAEMEHTNSELQGLVDHLSKEALEAHRERDKNSRKWKEEEILLRSELDAITKNAAELEEDVRRLTRDKAELGRSARDGERMEEIRSEELLQAHARIQSLEGALQSVGSAREDVDRITSAAIEERRELERQVRELQDEVEILRSMRDEFEFNAARVEELSWELESREEENARLRERLGVLEPEVMQAQPDKGNKTLFSEVEDKRKELESRHRHLTSKHTLLLKSHTQTLQQQERLKSHVSRLTQISNSKNGSDQTQMLMDAVAQAQSENKQLRNRIASLEEQLTDVKLLTPMSFTAIARGSVSKEEAGQLEGVINCLRSELEQSTQTIAKKSAELRTANLIRLNETDKLRGTEKALLERQKDLEIAVAQNVKLKFELDEARAVMRRRFSTDATAGGNGETKAAMRRLRQRDVDMIDTDQQTDAASVCTRGTQTEARSLNIHRLENGGMATFEGNTAKSGQLAEASVGLPLKSAEAGSDSRVAFPTPPPSSPPVQKLNAAPAPFDITKHLADGTPNHQIEQKTPSEPTIQPGDRDVVLEPKLANEMARAKDGERSSPFTADGPRIINAKRLNPSNSECKQQ